MRLRPRQSRGGISTGLPTTNTLKTIEVRVPCHLRIIIVIVVVVIIVIVVVVVVVVVVVAIVVVELVSVVIIRIIVVSSVPSDGSSSALRRRRSARCSARLSSHPPSDCYCHSCASMRAAQAHLTFVFVVLCVYHRFC